MMIKERAMGALVGLACGDAVGTTLEFELRGTFEPLTDMEGGGPFELEKGQWTDDTSMALCLAHSLLFSKGFCATDQMNRYCNWYNYGYMSSNGQCFDIGMTVRDALTRYLDSGEPMAGDTSPNSAGNGSLMRLAPIAIFYHRNIKQAIKYAGLSSATTHGCAECIEACQLFAALLIETFQATEKLSILKQTAFSPSQQKLKPIASGDFLNKRYEDLTGSGYVIESLESALWCFFNANSFEEAILMAANIGNDADTTAAICGQIAGAFYGLSAIVADWRASITDSDDIHRLAEALFEQGA